MASSEVGQGEYRYVVQAGWPRLPEGWEFQEVVGVATDSRDRVYCFDRGPHPVMVFEADGTFVASWGQGQFVHPHGITMAPDDTLWLIDDFDHTARRYTLDGELLQTLGRSGQPSDTGATSIDFRTIRRSSGPFCYPCNLAMMPDGDLVVADGYGNARVHRFSSEGSLRFSRGNPGDGPLEFHVVHGVAVDKTGRIYIADRENCRIQLLDAGGRFLGQWTDVARPCEVFIDAAGNAIVAELGFRGGMWPGTSPPSPDATGGRVSVFDPYGRLLSRFGGGNNPTAPGDFFTPHDVWVDSKGDLYVSEVCRSGAAVQGIELPGAHTLQKFVRSRS
jgi:DNA-binding beta-propeller fold protein YncE